MTYSSAGQGKCKMGEKPESKKGSAWKEGGEKRKIDSWPKGQRKIPKTAPSGQATK